MSAKRQRTCPSCGNEFSGGMEFCPVCMLRKGLAGGIESGESSFQEAIQPSKRFEHYELVTGEDGKPVELGRSAMGVNGRISFFVCESFPSSCLRALWRTAPEQQTDAWKECNRRVDSWCCVSHSMAHTYV
jgi:hypothetical protein